MASLALASLLGSSVAPLSSPAASRGVSSQRFACVSYSCGFAFQRQRVSVVERIKFVARPRPVSCAAEGTGEAVAAPPASGPLSPAGVTDTVRKVIARQLSTSLDKVLPETRFVDLGADSLDTVEIVMALETEFDIEIEEENAEKISTVKDAADLIVDVLKQSKS